jgi:chemotaxis signal transduction protein
MATLLRSRRFADRATEPTDQYITFQLQQYRFALPIQHLKRVSLLKQENNALSGIDALSSESEAVRWINVEQQIFAATSSPAISASNPTQPQPGSCVILFSDPKGQTIGLIIDNQPKMQRIAQSQIVSLLEDKTDSAHLQSVAVSLIQINGEPPIFLLDLGRLCDL